MTQFTQEICVTHPNKDHLFSAISLVSIYRERTAATDQLYVISQLIPKSQDQAVADLLQSEVIQLDLEDADHPLPYDDLIMTPPSLHQETMSKDVVKERLQHAKLLYGKDILASTQQMSFVNLQQFQRLNIEWIKRMILGNFWLGAGTIASFAMTGIFAVQRMGENVGNLFRKPGGP